MTESATDREDDLDRPELALLLQQYQEGRPEAAAALVERVSPRILYFLLAKVRDRSLAEDLLQDFWLRIHRARHTYRLGEPVWPWFLAIARRVQIDAYRRRSRVARHELQTDTIPERPMANNAAGESENGSNLIEMIRGLPENQREAVLLLKVNGLSLEEASRTLGISVGAVKQRAHRAFEALRTAFGKRA